jgi:chromosome segregation ATPase
MWDGYQMICSKHLERKIVGCLQCRIDLRDESINELEAEVERLSYLWKSDVDAYTELEAEVERLESALEKLEGDYDTALEWNIELEEQLASARAALEKYGKHADDCHYEEVEGTIDGTIPIKHQIRPCTCGLEQALKG